MTVILCFNRKEQIPNISPLQLVKVDAFKLQEVSECNRQFIPTMRLVVLNDDNLESNAVFRLIIFHLWVFYSLKEYLKEYLTFKNSVIYFIPFVIYKCEGPFDFLSLYIKCNIISRETLEFILI